MGTVPKSNRKVVEREAKIVTPGFTHKYMAAHFPGLVQALQYLQLPVQSVPITTQS
jgi:phosphoribosylcarboxyaminoimidazole (NCAIR) mutase